MGVMGNEAFELGHDIREVGVFREVGIGLGTDGMGMGKNFLRKVSGDENQQGRVVQVLFEESN